MGSASYEKRPWPFIPGARRNQEMGLNENQAAGQKTEQNLLGLHLARTLLGWGLGGGRGDKSNQKSKTPLASPRTGGWPTNAVLQAGKRTEPQGKEKDEQNEDKGKTCKNRGAKSKAGAPDGPNPYTGSPNSPPSWTPPLGHWEVLITLLRRSSAPPGAQALAGVAALL